MEELMLQVQEVIESIREELKKLNFELTNVIPKELEKARSYGDLSENAEYQMTKERQAFVETRVSQLNRRLSELSNLRLDNLPRQRVGLFSKVFLEDEEGRAYHYALVLPEMVDKNPENLSVTSPRAKALLGKSPGDTVSLQTERGPVEAEIIRFINPWGEVID
jgi:transcription elongation factor GreA